MGKKIVILIHPTTQAEIPHEEEHAKRLLAMPNNGGGWKIKPGPDDGQKGDGKEKKENAANRKRNKGKARKASESRQADPGD